MTLSTRLHLLTLPFVCLALTAHADLRPLATDRPDTTENPHTVDKNHYQIEIEPVSWGRDDEDHVKTTTISSSYNLKFGVADNMDLQLVLSPYNVVKTEMPDDTETAHGVGDTELRWKINFWGNDAGETAFALMPFVKFPTADSDIEDNDHTEYGLIAPFAFALPGEWDAAVMLEIDHIRNADDDGYTTSFVESFTTSHAIVADWSCFFEFVNVHSRDDAIDDERYFNTGVAYALSPNMQMDFGTNIGVSNVAEDRRFFVGFSLKQ